MPADKPDRNPIIASYWQWDGTEPDGDPEVEAMDAAVSLVRSDEGRVLLAVRGKPRRRYEPHDSAWLELTDTEVLRLISRLSAMLTIRPEWLPPQTPAR